VATPTSDTTTRPALHISGTQVLGGALAAITAAVAGSTLGLNGTLAGAAAGSIIGTVGGAVYTHSLRRTREGVRVVVQRAPATRAAVPAASVETAAAAPALDGGRRFSRPVAIAAASAVAFGVGVGTLTLGEVVAGRPASSIVAGDGGAGTTLGARLGSSAAGAADLTREEVPPASALPAPAATESSPALESDVDPEGSEQPGTGSPGGAATPSAEPTAPATAVEPTDGEAPAPVVPPAGAPAAP
jgi:hypothetical protein